MLLNTVLLLLDYDQQTNIRN